jgi:antibiotic biosynthesis monooxygenase (ABM) superfamily enzyme
LLSGWTEADPLAASQYVAAMPPSESREQAIVGMVTEARWQDPAVATAWANELSRAEGREKAMTLVAEAYIRKDPDGAADWLPTSGLPIETQERLVQGKKE